MNMNVVYYIILYPIILYYNVHEPFFYDADVVRRSL